MSTPEYLNQKQLEKLAADPKNRVYQYVNDEATAKFTVAQQKKFVVLIRKWFEEQRQLHPTWSDLQIREELKKSPDMKLFAENNSRIFETLASRDATQDNLNHIRYMLYLREQQDMGVIDEMTAQNMIQDYLITAFKTNMTPAEYEAKMAANTKPKTTAKTAKKK